MATETTQEQFLDVDKFEQRDRAAAVDSLQALAQMRWPLDQESTVTVLRVPSLRAHAYRRDIRAWADHSSTTAYLMSSVLQSTTGPSPCSSPRFGKALPLLTELAIARRSLTKPRARLRPPKRRSNPHSYSEHLSTSRFRP